MKWVTSKFKALKKYLATSDIAITAKHISRIERNSCMNIAGIITYLNSGKSKSGLFTTVLDNEANYNVRNAHQPNRITIKNMRIQQKKRMALR